MKKVAMFVTNPCHADARVLKEAKALSEAGWKVRIYALGADLSPIHVYPDVEIAGEKRTFKWVPFLFLRSLFSYLVFNFNVAKRAKSWGASIAHAHDLSTLLGAVLFKVKSGGKVVYDSHELWIHRNRGGRLRWVERAIERFFESLLIRRADLVIVVSDGISKYLQGFYSLQKAPLVIKNVPIIDSDSTLIEKDLRGSLNIPSDEKLVLYCGLITAGRGISEFLESMVGNTHLWFVMIGPVNQPYTENLMSGLPQSVRNRVKLLDSVKFDQVVKNIRGADFSLVCIEPVCLSYELSLPNKFFESLAAGVPVLSYGSKEVNALVQKHKIGFSVNSFRELVKNINEIGSPALNQLKLNVRELAKGYSWELESRELLAAYEGLGS